MSALGGKVDIIQGKADIKKCLLMTQRTFAKIELSLRCPKRFFKGASQGMIVFTRKRDDVGSLFLRQRVRIAPTLRGSVVVN